MRSLLCCKSLTICCIALSLIPLFYCLNNCDNVPCPQPKEAGSKIQVILIGVCMRISLDQRLGCIRQACISFNTPCNFRCQRFNRLWLEKTWISWQRYKLTFYKNELPYYSHLIGIFKTQISMTSALSDQSSMYNLWLRTSSIYLFMLE